MKEFIEKQIVSYEKVSEKKHDLKACMLVKKVAPVSVAAHLEIRPGAFLEKINKKPASKVDLVTLKGKHRYLFYFPDKREQWELTTNGIPLGIELERTNEAILDDFENGRANPDDLVVIWERGNWALLEKASYQGMYWGRSWLQKILALIGLKSYYVDPALLLYAAALYEQGKHELAMIKIEEYEKYYAQYWTTNFHALIDFYYAQEDLRKGEIEQGVSLLQRSYQYHPYDRVLKQMKSLGYNYSPTHRWQGNPFSLDYKLPLCEGKGEESLSQNISQMKYPQVFILCFLATYRANGPYNEFMLEYIRYQKYFSDFIAGMHIITMEKQRPQDRPDWFVGEDYARGQELPFHVLHDIEGKITYAVDLSHSPFFLILDQEGKVIHEGSWNELELWSLLARK